MLNVAERRFMFTNRACSSAGNILPMARPRVIYRPIGRDGFVQILILLFQIHKVGDIEEGVALQANIYESRLHAWQHARHTAFINGTR